MKDWLNDIHDKLGDFETKAPEGLWARIETAQAASDAGKAAPFALWGKRIAAVGAVAAAIVAGVIIFGRHSATVPSQILADSQQDIHIADETIQDSPSADYDGTVDDVETNYLPADYHGTASLQRIPAEMRKTPEDIPGLDAVPMEQECEERHPGHEDRSDATSADSKIVAEELNHDMNATSDRQVESQERNGKATVVPLRREERVRKARKGSGAMSIGIINSYGAQSTELLAYGGAAMSVAGPQENVAWDDSPTLGMMLYNRSVGEVKYTHRMPVRVGVTLDWQLSDRWFLESGVTYTRLNSQTRQGNETDYATAFQKLDYVGIPLNVKFKAFGTRNFGLYATAGMNVDKCVSAKCIGNYSYTTEWGTESGSLGTEKIADRPLQFSVNLAAGVAYLISPLVSLYVEPGMSYYFDDKSSLNTIYKERPLNFSMNMGLRFTLTHGR